MPAQSAAPAASGGPAGGEAAPVEEKPKEKTVFNVNLTKIDAAQKAKAIREVKALMTGMNLVEVSQKLSTLSLFLISEAD